MNKTLHIFAKDVRHLWPEILLSLASAAGYAVIEPWTWPLHVLDRPQDALIVVVNVLLPLSWFLLIARAAHDESLVGDRQFWVTRPCTWPALLSAKCLFVLAFLCLPIFCMKCWLLRAAGLPILANLPTLGDNMLATCLVVLLPLFALAAVTAHLVRMFLVTLALTLYLAVALYINNILDGAFPVHRIPGEDGGAAWGLLVLTVLMAVIVLQYARRRTVLSRVLLLTTLVLVTTAALIDGHRQNVSSRFLSLTAGEAAPFTVTLNPHPDPLPLPELLQLPGLPPEDLLSPDDRIRTVSVPILIDGIASGHAIRLEDIDVAWTVAGKAERHHQYLQGGSPYTTRTADALQINVSDAYSDGSLKDAPLTAEVTFAVVEAEQTDRESVTLANKLFSVPDHAVCGPQSEDQTSLTTCRYPLQSPPLTLVSGRWTDQHCSVPSKSGAEGHAWIGDVDRSLLKLNFDPVTQQNIYLSEGTYGPKGELRRFLCPGTRLDFQHYQVVRRRLVHVTLPAITPRDFTRQQRGYINTRYRHDF